MQLLCLQPPCAPVRAPPLTAAGVPLPVRSCSWYMTWFAHDVPSLAQIARLFDLFLSSHPLMPLYVAAVAIKVGDALVAVL